MKTTVLCVGKLKEKYWSDAIAEYSKRLSAYCKLEITEVPEGKNESQSLLEKINERDYTVALDIAGKRFSSEAFSFFCADVMNRGYGGITFIIGGSCGLGDEVKSKCNFSVSFSDMTFPHQMMRVFLLEQIYRSWKIIRNEPYHK